ncbi:MAG: RNA 2',3'-cyclic phosphodiesterase [Candidatus Woesearchaeota archaeon]
MRLFIAFGVSEKAKEELKRLQAGLGSGADLKPVRDFHLTLKFLGDVDEKNINSIKEKLRSVRFNAFDAELCGAGVFPSESHIRVVWAGVEPKDTISRLQQEIDSALERMFPKEKRFRPHITLARVRSVRDKSAFMDRIRSLSPKKVSFRVEKFELIKSTLTGEGPVYETIEEFP